MFAFLFALLLLPAVRISTSKELVVFDNFDDGAYVFGPEETMADYAVLGFDGKMDLPSSFTICSSVHMHFMTFIISFYQLYQDDGKPWFMWLIRTERDLKRFQEHLELRFSDQILGGLDTVPIMPNSWYHACTALDTVSGHITIVVNGHIIFDQVLEEFNNFKKPKSLEGRLGLFKVAYPIDSGMWLNLRTRLTNLNVYNSALTDDKMINLTDGESCSEEGDYLSWKEAQWNVTGYINQETTIKEEALCFQPRSNLVLFTAKFVDWEDCMLFCEKFPNTRSPSVRTDKELLEMMRAVKRIQNLNPREMVLPYWIAVTDSKIEGQWVDYYTSDPVDIKGVAAGKIDGGEIQNCGLILTARGGWQDWECRTRSQVMCLCESKGQMFLTLRGLCPDSNIDQYFVPQNNDTDGQAMFRGLFNTIIEYHKADNLWHLRVVGSNSKTVATSSKPKPSFLLGISEWTVTGDNFECNNGMPYTTVLKLSGCKDTEFTCHDGQCIKMEERCDQIIHCRDQSDEKYCSLLVLKQGYNRKVAPFIYDKARKEVDPVRVDVSTSVQHIIEISEVNNIIGLKFEIRLQAQSP